MVIAWQRNATRWRESQETAGNCEGRDSVRDLVSGDAGVLLAYPRQGQVAAAHQTLGTAQEMANLCAQFAIGRPSRAHGVHAKQGPGNVTMPSARLRCIERLQGVQMQQRCAARRPRLRVGNFTAKHAGLCLVLGQSCARGWLDRHQQSAGSTVFQFRGQRGTQTVCAMRCHDDQLPTRMRNALAPRDLPGTEGLADSGIVLACGAYMEPLFRANGPQWMR